MHAAGLMERRVHLWLPPPPPQELPPEFELQLLPECEPLEELFQLLPDSVLLQLAMVDTSDTTSA
jgi:hypothetical protein